MNSKIKKCTELGIRTCKYHFTSEVSEKEVLQTIHSLNDNKDVHGIIVQLPIAEHLDKLNILQSISVHKDVDGLHPMNLGLLFGGYRGGFIPCTPKGCVRLISSVQDEIKGMLAVVIGTSNLVGKPMAQLLLQQGCTVASVNTNTVNPELLSSQADIIVSAAGHAGLVTASWVKRGAIIIDVGINRLPNSSTSNNVVGDVDFDNVYDKVRAISPVPGGVGPMTIACLLENTVIAAGRQSLKIANILQN